MHFLQRTVLERKNWCQENNNTNVFAFGNTEVRKLLADIQVEEQNHAECCISINGEWDEVKMPGSGSGS